MAGDAGAILTTERLVLRRLRADEAGEVAAYKNDPDVARYQDWDLPYRVEDIAAKIAGYLRRTWPCLGSGLNVAIEHRGELVGDFGVGWDDDGNEAEVGYTLRRPEYHEEGFATEVLMAVVDRLFSEGIERVKTSVDPEDVASIRVLERSGFRFETSSRVEIRGEWVDDHVYVTTRADCARRIDGNSEQR